MKVSRVLASVLWLMLLATILAEQVFSFGWAASDAYYLLTVFAFTIAIFGWFLADAHERSFKPSLALKIAVAAVGTIAVPYYKFRYFGARAGFSFLGILLLAFFAMAVVSAVIEYLLIGGAAA